MKSLFYIIVSVLVSASAAQAETFMMTIGGKTFENNPNYYCTQPVIENGRVSIYPVSWAAGLTTVTRTETETNIHFEVNVDFGSCSRGYLAVPFNNGFSPLPIGNEATVSLDFYKSQYGKAQILEKNGVKVIALDFDKAYAFKKAKYKDFDLSFYPGTGNIEFRWTIRLIQAQRADLPGLGG